MLDKVTTRYGDLELGMLTLLTGCVQEKEILYEYLWYSRIRGKTSISGYDQPCWGDTGDNQFKFGMGVAKEVWSGNQVIIATNSDHILNGIRVAVKEGVLDCSLVTIYYFDTEGVMHTPKIDKDGRIDKWPEGFFDTWDKALERLI
jgi:hypothetical protein